MKKRKRIIIIPVFILVLYLFLIFKSSTIRKVILPISKEEDVSLEKPAFRGPPPFPLLIHISDLHCGKSFQDPDCINTKSLFKHIIERYRTKNQRPVIVNTGDFVDDGTKEQFDTFNRILTDLLDSEENQFPGQVTSKVIELDRVLYTPGNHDYGIQGLFPFNDYFINLQPNTTDYPTEKTIERLRFIGLNSILGVLNQGIYKKIINAGGEFGKEQLSKLEEKLENYDPKKEDFMSEERLILYFHHHLFIEQNLNSFIRARYDLVDNAQFLNLTDTYKSKIDLILFGHHHTRKVYDEGKPVYIAERESTDLIEVNDTRTFCFVEIDFNKRGVNEREEFRNFEYEIITFSDPSLYKVQGVFKKGVVWVKKKLLSFLFLGGSKF